MNILHITQYCHISSVGGTERYIKDLVCELRKIGCVSAIAWLSPHTKKFLVQDVVPVYGLPGTSMRVDPPHDELKSFLDCTVDDFCPDIIHFHTFSRSEAAIALWATQHSIPYCFTYHSPGWTCRREDLMAFGGLKPCDGEVRTFRCSACKMHERVPKLPQAFAWLVAGLSVPLSLLQTWGRQTSFRRRTAFIADTRALRFALRNFLSRCNCSFACAEWSVPVLERNGAVPKHILLCPQGVSGGPEEGSSSEETSSRDNYFTVAYIGRVVPVKGVDILINAFSHLSARDIRLKIYGWPKEEAGAFHRYIRAFAAQDERIELIPRMPLEKMQKEYINIDLLCIPSRWPETGPLVLFEAFARGIPVYGSSLVGQIGLLKQRGRIVEPNEEAHWEEHLCEAHDLWTKGGWREERKRAFGQEPLRTMKDVACEVSREYSRIYEKI